MDAKRRKIRPGIALSESENERVIAALVASEHFRAYTRAFESLTGFAITLHPLKEAPLSRVFTLKIGERVAGIIKMEEAHDGAVKRDKLDQNQLRAARSLIEIFSRQLSEASNQILIQSQKHEPLFAVQAKAYISKNSRANLSLGQTDPSRFSPRSAGGKPSRVCHPVQ